MGAFKPQTTIEELMDTGIISVHLYNCLKTAGFDDFNSIFQFRKRNGLLSFLNLKNFGRKALSELEELFSGCYVPQAPIHPTTEGMVQVSRHSMPHMPNSRKCSAASTLPRQPSAIRSTASQRCRISKKKV